MPGAERNDTNAPVESVESVESTESSTLKKSFLPRPRIDRFLRKQLGKPRTSSGVSVYTTAGLEALFKEILKAANKEALAGRKKRIGEVSLMKAVRSNPDIARVFKNYSFFRPKNIKYNALELMTKDDRDAATKKRKTEKDKKARVAAVPQVDEE